MFNNWLLNTIETSLVRSRSVLCGVSTPSLAAATATACKWKGAWPLPPMRWKEPAGGRGSSTHWRYPKMPLYFQFTSHPSSFLKKGLSSALGNLSPPSAPTCPRSSLVSHSAPHCCGSAASSSGMTPFPWSTPCSDSVSPAPRVLRRSLSLPLSCRILLYSMLLCTHSKALCQSIVCNLNSTFSTL